MERINALIKFIKSYFKRDWGFEDYPIKYWENPNAGERKVDYGAGIINWTIMVGHGETYEKALIALKENFKTYKDNNNILPRPGRKVPLKFVSSEKIDTYEMMAVDFFEKILEMNYYDGYFSDGSSLTDFELSDDEHLINKYRNKIIRQILNIYNVDITDIYYEPLWKIFEAIDSKNKI